MLKKFLRDLPEPMFLESSYNVIRRCPLPKPGDDFDMSTITYIRDHVLTELAPCTYIVLSAILRKLVSLISQMTVLIRTLKI